jgi:hypothetical protein
VDTVAQDLEETLHDVVPFLGFDRLGEVHRSLHVGEEHGYLLPLAFEGRARGEDLLGEVLGSVGAWIGRWAERTRADRLATVHAELGSPWYLSAAGGAVMPQLRAALEAEPGVLRILSRAAPTAHLQPALRKLFE